MHSGCLPVLISAVAIIAGLVIMGQRRYDGDTPAIIGGLITIVGAIIFFITAIAQYPAASKQKKAIEAYKREGEKNRANQPVKCPNCGSTQIQIVKKGFGAGKAAAGGLLLGPIGLAAGAIGSERVERVCMNCMHKF